MPVGWIQGINGARDRAGPPRASHALAWLFTGASSGHQGGHGFAIKTREEDREGQGVHIEEVIHVTKSGVEILSKRSADESIIVPIQPVGPDGPLTSWTDDDPALIWHDSPR